jgi:hypothetical protein
MKHIKTFESLIDPIAHDLFDLWNLIKIVGPIEQELSSNFEKGLSWSKEDFIDDHGALKVYICSGEDTFGDDWSGTGDYIHDELDEVTEIETGFDLTEKIDKKLEKYLNSLEIDYKWVKKSLSERYIKTEFDLDIDNLRKIFEANKIQDPNSKDFAYILRYTFGNEQNFINLWYYKINDGSYFFTVD